MSNDNLLGTVKKAESIETNKPAAFKLNMSGQTTPMPQATSLEEKTKAFQFKLPTKEEQLNDVAVETSVEQPAKPTQATQEVAAESVEGKGATNLSQYQHPDQPETATEEITATFKANLLLLQEAFGKDKEAVAYNVRNCMEYLQNHPELKEILRPDDVQQMVRGLRTSYSGISTAKRNKQSKAKKSNVAVDEVVDLLGEFDLTL